MSDTKSVRFKTTVVAEQEIRTDQDYWIEKEKITDKLTFVLQLESEYKGALLKLENLDITDGRSIELPSLLKDEMLKKVETTFDKYGIPYSKEEVSVRANCKYGKGGEGERHKAIKEYVEKHPEAIGVKNVLYRETEHVLLSGDRLDVYFELSTREHVAVEVKPKSSGDDDILRGIFQCVKYKAVLDAEDIAHNTTPNNNSLLVIEGTLSKSNKRVIDTLGIKVIENLKID
jgi:hypothetical protein